MPHPCHFNGDKLDGALKYLYNTHTSENYPKFVSASCSSHHYTYIPENAIDFNETTIWHPAYPNDGPGDYVQIDLLHHFLIIEAYTIQTSNLPPDSAHPKDWAFSASFDNKTWSEEFRYIDSDEQMNGNLKKLVVPVSLNGKYKHFRIIVTGNSYSPEEDKQPRMDVNQIELFGTLYQDSEHVNLTCKIKRTIFLSPAIFLFCILY